MQSDNMDTKTYRHACRHACIHYFLTYNLYGSLDSCALYKPLDCLTCNRVAPFQEPRRDPVEQSQFFKPKRSALDVKTLKRLEGLYTSP